MINLLPFIVGLAADALSVSPGVKQIVVENAPLVVGAVAGGGGVVAVAVEWICRIIPTKNRRGFILGAAKVLHWVENAYVWAGKIIPYMREALEALDKKADKLVKNKVK